MTEKAGGSGLRLWRYGIALAAVSSAWLALVFARQLQPTPSIISLAVIVPLVTFAAVALLVFVVNERRLRARASEHEERERFRATLSATARELEDQRARFEAVLQQMPAGVAIVEAPSGNLLLQNQRSEGILGVPLGATLEVSHERLKAAFRQIPPLEGWPIVRALRSGEMVHNADLESIRANGDRLVIRASASPIRDASGAMIAAVTTFEDVTDLKVAEQSLQFLEEASTTLAASLDLDATLQSVVDLAVPRLADWCLLHTVGGDDVAARLTTAHVDPKKAGLLEMLYQQYPVPADARHGYPHVLRTGEAEFVPDVPPTWSTQARDQNHADLLRQLELHSLICLPLRVAGRTVGALTLATGDSGRRYRAAEYRLAEHFARRVAIAVDNARLYRESAEADRRKSEFLALMAHELRNPLAPMRNAVEILRLSDDPVATEQMRALLERQLGYMARLIDDLVDLSRIERNKIALRLESVDVAAVARRAIDVHRHTLTLRKQILVETIPTTAVTLRADATRLEQIISNLLDNAAKYTGPGGTIEVRVEALDASVQIAVRDSGRGIRPEFLPHVFDSFHRGDQPGTEGGGLGIGLTLVKRLTELHGGTIVARSAGVGQGSEFVVTLPLPLVDPGSMEGTSTPAATTARLRALICDDNTRAADTLGTLLELWGYEVDVVYDGESAVAAVNTQWPDVALLDLALPGMDGYEVAGQLRRHPRTRPLLIVAITGHGRDEDRHRSREAGFDHHMVKPIDPPALHALLRDLAPRRGAASPRA